MPGFDEEFNGPKPQGHPTKLGQMKGSLEELDPFALAELTQNLEKSSALLLRLAGVNSLEELRKRS